MSAAPAKWRIRWVATKPGRGTWQATKLGRPSPISYTNLAYLMNMLHILELEDHIFGRSVPLGLQL